MFIKFRLIHNEKFNLVIPAKQEKEFLPKVLNELKKYKVKIVVLEKKILIRLNQYRILIVKFYFKKKWVWSCTY